MGQRQIQSLNLLAMGADDLREEIYAQAEKNPALEIEDDDFESGVKNVRVKTSLASDYLRVGSASAAGEEKSRAFQEVLESRPDERRTLFAHLMEQLSFLRIPPEEGEYLAGKISVLRNPALANVFYRLGIVEIFGTGVLCIKECYKDCVIKPEFQISDNSISVLLPLSRMALPLSADERTVYEALSRNIPKAISEILHSLASSGFVRIMGNGRGTKYCL